MPTLAHYRHALGEASSDVGIAAAAPIFQVSYWNKKSIDPSFHCGTQGGARNFKYSLEVQHELEKLLWSLAIVHPTWSLAEFVVELNNNGFLVNREFIRVIFHKWRWSWKRADPKQPHKYSIPNMNYTIEFVLWIRTVPFTRLKYLDESHFNSKGLFIFVVFVCVMVVIFYRFPESQKICWSNFEKACCFGQSKHDHQLQFDFTYISCA